MAKKQSSNRRAQVKELPKQQKKLGAGAMKKVRAGLQALPEETINFLKKPDGTIKSGGGAEMKKVKGGI